MTRSLTRLTGCTRLFDSIEPAGVLLFCLVFVDFEFFLLALLGFAVLDFDLFLLALLGSAGLVFAFFLLVLREELFGTAGEPGCHQGG